MNGVFVFAYICIDVFVSCSFGAIIINQPRYVKVYGLDVCVCVCV